MRLGVVSDIHWNVDTAAPPQAWHNPHEPEALDRRLGEALALFIGAEAGAVVLLGDLSDRGDEASLDCVLARTARWERPVCVVGGNHDLDRAGLARVAAAHGAALLDGETVEQEGALLTGIGVEPTGSGAPRFRSLAAPVLPTSGLAVVASHYPLLSEAARLADAGLPYPGDLVDRDGLALFLAEAGDPVVVLSGHAHARCTQTRGPLLQLSFGALIEPPFDCAVVRLEETRVTRSSHRLGPIAAFEPVFAPAEESWLWTGEAWRAESNGV